MIRRMKVTHGIALVAPVLGSLSACDFSLGEDEIPLRDQGVGGKDVAEARAVTTLWVDPTSRVVVASVGSMEVTGDFGRYASDFDTRLRRGPGYR